MRSMAEGLSHGLVRLAGLSLVAAFGCSDDTPSGPTAGGKVVVLTESATATTQTIGPAGGTIQATGSNGIKYTLVIPERALLRDTAITLTPVREIQGLPLSGGLVAAVDFKPSGLAFVNPATLSITTAARPTGDLKMVGLSYAGDGDSLGLALIEVGASDVSFTVTHFSGLGLGFGTTQNVLSLARANPPPSNSSQFYINSLAAARLQTPRDAAFELQVMEDWFDDVVLLALRNATTDAQLVTAFQELFAWSGARSSLNSLISPTPTLDTRDTQWFKQELGPKIGQAIAGNLQLCATQGTIASARIAALDNAIYWMFQGIALGAGPAGSFTDQAAFASVSCARVVTVSVVPPPDPMQVGFPHSLDITFGLKFVNDPTPVPGNFSVTVLASNVTVGTPQGLTALSPRGFFTTVVTAQSSSVFLAVTACYVGHFQSSGGELCHTETIFTVSGQCSRVEPGFVFVGQPGPGPQGADGHLDVIEILDDLAFGASTLNVPPFDVDWPCLRKVEGLSVTHDPSRGSNFGVRNIRLAALTTVRNVNGTASVGISRHSLLSVEFPSLADVQRDVAITAPNLSRLVIGPANVGRDFTIQGTALTSLSSVSLRQVGRDVQVQNNPQLCQSEAQAFVNRVSAGRNRVAIGNKSC